MVNEFLSYEPNAAGAHVWKWDTEAAQRYGSTQQERDTEAAQRYDNTRGPLGRAIAGDDLTTIRERGESATTHPNKQ